MSMRMTNALPIRHSSFVIRSFLVAFSRACSILRISSRNLRRPLVLFARDGLFHFPPQPNQLGLLFGAAGTELRHLAHVPRFAVDVQQQRLELFREANVVVRAAEAALLAKFEESSCRRPGMIAGRAGPAPRLFRRRPDAAPTAPPSWAALRMPRPTAGVRNLSRAVLAQMQFIRLAVDQIGDMKGGRLFALLAFHDIAPRAARTVSCSGRTYLQHNPTPQPRP